VVTARLPRVPADEDVAFTEGDVRALSMTSELVSLGILGAGSQSALVRTWGRSHARLAEWQAELLAGLALEHDRPERIAELVVEVMPRVEKLQDYVWRGHLVGAAQRLLATVDAGADATRMAVVFTDIVGYTSRSKNLPESELVDLVETFEDETTRAVVAVDGRGEDDGDPFPRVRAASPTATSRPASVTSSAPPSTSPPRLTSLARPGAVLVDRGAFEALTGQGEVPDTAPDGTPLARLLDKAADELAEISPYAEHEDLRFRRLRRTSVKGYRALEPWLVRKSQRPERAEG